MHVESLCDFLVQQFPTFLLVVPHSADQAWACHCDVSLDHCVCYMLTYYFLFYLAPSVRIERTTSSLTVKRNYRCATREYSLAVRLGLEPRTRITPSDRLAICSNTIIGPHLRNTYTDFGGGQRNRTANCNLQGYCVPNYTNPPKFVIDNLSFSTPSIKASTTGLRGENRTPTSCPQNTNATTTLHGEIQQDTILVSLKVKFLNLLKVS